MNSKWHLYISFAKSAIRLAGGVLSLWYGRWEVLAYGVVLAEVLGVLEELGDKR